MTRRKLLRASLVGGAGIAGAAALAGCGETQIVEVEKQVVVEKVVTEVVEKIVEVTAAAEMKPELRSANLRFQLWYPTPVPALKNIADLLNQKYPQLKVEVEAPGDYWTKLQTAIAGGAAPDSWWMNNVNVWAWANKGALEDLTPYVKKDMQVGDDLEQTWKTSADNSGPSRGRFGGVPRRQHTGA
ncbi:MAG: extracellular solute-binding protein, partial [Chloroflexi bacterium]|nr:extracellular solute-binding protein [Chloroflexota bacterium]